MGKANTKALPSPLPVSQAVARAATVTVKFLATFATNRIMCAHTNDLGSAELATRQVAAKDPALFFLPRAPLPAHRRRSRSKT